MILFSLSTLVSQAWTSALNSRLLYFNTSIWMFNEQLRLYYPKLNSSSAHPDCFTQLVGTPNLPVAQIKNLDIIYDPTLSPPLHIQPISKLCDSTLNIQNPTTSYHLPSFQVIYVTINSHLNYYKSLLTGLFHPCPLYRQQRSYSQIKYKSDLVTPVYKTAQ